MKKIFSILLMAIVVLNLFTMSKVVKAENNMKKILIDAGHGGIDGGATSKSGIVEKDINLAISLKLRDNLKQAGYEVEMTRDTDDGLYKSEGTIKEKKRADLANRVKMKRTTSPDIFISIHQNTFPEEKYKGMQVWYAPNSKESELLAKTIQSEFKEQINLENSREAKNAGTQFRVIREAPLNGAGIIVECGFLTNQEECTLLSSEEYQNKFAKMLKESVDKYFKIKENVDKN
ncbi:MAG: N-acetylmuramoyl-L-alanine amidase CwlD [Sarcina sp.]